MFFFRRIKRKISKTKELEKAHFQENLNAFSRLVSLVFTRDDGRSHSFLPNLISFIQSNENSFLQRYISSKVRYQEYKRFEENGMLTPLREFFFNFCEALKEQGDEIDFQRLPDQLLNIWENFKQEKASVFEETPCEELKSGEFLEDSGMDTDSSKALLFSI